MSPDVYFFALEGRVSIAFLIFEDEAELVPVVLSRYEERLGVSIMDMNGNSLASNSKKAFREAFVITEDRGLTIAEVLLLRPLAL